MNEVPMYITQHRGEILSRYEKDMFDILSKICYRLEPDEIMEGITYSVNKRFKDGKAVIDNTYTKKKAEIDFSRLADDLLGGKVIMTTSGVLFKKYKTVKNPFYNFVQYLADKRDEAKKKMKQYPKGSEMYNKYNLQQLNYKVSCNALYGCCGNFSSLFYNLNLCTAVTGQGRGCISASITMFEGFLADNVRFGSITECLTYINNICNDLKNPEFNKFNHYEILDRQITVDECFLRLLRNFGYNDCVPDDDGIELLYKTVANLSQPELNIIYYKNNLYEFINNSKVKNIIITALVKLKDPFLSPTEVPEEIEDELKVLKDLMFEFIYYRHIWIDKLDRVYTMPRDVVLLTDTDSCIVSLDEWYRTILEWTIGVPMEIKYTREEIEKEMDKIILHKRKTEPIKEYDFYNQELVDAKRLKYPAVIIEEDNLRYSIVNILSYILSDIILDYMYLFGENYNAQTDNRECLLIMKNEFLFKSMFITNGKKNYADLQVLQEGNIIPEDKQLDIKGMPISKVGIPESTSQRLMDILEYDILRESFVDQVDLIRKFVVLEKDIIKSLKAKSKEYHKPARLAPMASYKAPMSQQGIKASYAYNAIKSNEEEGIDLEDRNTVLIIKTKINTKNYNIIENEFPEHTLRLAKLLNTPEYKGNITSIAIPTNIDIPSWIIPFIDYNTIVQDNLRSFPLKELGISKLESKNVTHSNIVSF